MQRVCLFIVVLQNSLNDLFNCSPAALVATNIIQLLFLYGSFFSF